MAEQSTPWNTPTDFYEAEWRQYFTGALGEGGIVNDYSGDSLRVTASGSSTQIAVAAGQAISCGMLYTNTGAKTLDLASFGTAPSGSQTRIDLVVLRYVFSTRTVTVTVKAGTPSALNPTEPSLTRDLTGVWEQRVARIARTSNVPVTQAMITQQRSWLSPSGYSSSGPPALAAWPYASIVRTPDGELFRGADKWINRDQPDWNPLTLNSDLQEYRASPQYRIVRGYVELRGGVQRVNEGVSIASANTPKTLFVLPSGARPGRLYQYSLACTYAGSATVARLVLDDTGRGEFAAPVDGTTWVTLDGIKFQQVN